MGKEERRQREKENRHKTILKAAKKLFFKKGLENTTMDEIAEEAELSKGTLYIYFKSKEVLALNIINESSDLLYDTLRKADDTNKRGIERITDITQALTDFFIDNKKEFRFFRYMDTLTASLGSENDILKEWQNGIEELINVILAIVVDGIKDGSIRKDMEPDKIAFIYSNMILSFLIRLSSNKRILLMAQSMGEEEIIGTMFAMITKILESGDN